MKSLVKVLAVIFMLLMIMVVVLIKFVDPNEYRGYMIEQVEKKTDYKLEINGDLRWHVWPQISILVSDVKATAKNASVAMISAENMRLDVELFPLFSRQLSVKQVMLKGAVVRLTDDTKGTKFDSMSSTPNSIASSDSVIKATNWSFNLNKLQLLESLLVLQQGKNRNDLVTIRDVNVELVQKTSHQASIEANASINRDQQDLALSLMANLDLQAYPNQIRFDLTKLAYQFKHASDNSNRLDGEASMKVDYSIKSKRISLTELILKADNNLIRGNASGTLTDIPDFVIELSSDHLDIDRLLTRFSTVKPVINLSHSTNKSVTLTSTRDHNRSFNILRDFNAQLVLKVKSLISEGINVTELLVDANNKTGLVQLNTLSGKLLGGAFKLTGSINAQGEIPYVHLDPRLDNIDLDAVNKHFKLPSVLVGKLNLMGSLSGSDIDIAAFQRAWQGKMVLKITDAKLNGINIPQIIQKSVSLSNSDINIKERYDSYTKVRQLSADLLLRQGKITLSDIDVDSPALNINGTGLIDLAKIHCDLQLNIKLMQGWQGRKGVIDVLRAKAIPLHIYGPCSKLSYNVNAERILKEQFKSQAVKAIDKYLNKNKNDGELSEKDKAKKEILNKVLDRIF